MFYTEDLECVGYFEQLSGYQVIMAVLKHKSTSEKPIQLN